MAIAISNYIFLPWVRQGAAGGIQTPDMSTGQPGVASMSVTLRINNSANVERRVQLYGPGDVTGIDPQQVIRMEPPPLSTDFEPNYFPAIEFDRPDFPWMFTPATADSAGRLRPWLCLVVVQKQAGVTLDVSRNRPLPVLELMSPAKPEQELPELSESWAWAHAQVTGSLPDTESLRRSLAGDPALTVSRLLCPRRLDPTTDYLACVVPTFELGRKAGLGEPITSADERALKPAWDFSGGTRGAVRLPVYVHWEFRTGVAGDFETLVSLLEARQLPQEVGKRRMHIGQPGFQITPPLPEGTVVDLEGALSVLSAPAAEWPESSRIPFQKSLKPILDAPWRAMKEGMEPVLAPPIYGGWQAARHTVNLGTESPTPALTWLDELNLDPRHRAIAAVGTRVVQDQQERLMASAWEQLGEIERINRVRRQAQLSRAVNMAYHTKHFMNFSKESLLKVVAVAQRRLTLTGVNTSAGGVARQLLSERIARSGLPTNLLSSTVRRLTNPRSVLSVRFKMDGASSLALVQHFNDTSMVPLGRVANSLVTIDDVPNATGGIAAPLNAYVRFERITESLTVKNLPVSDAPDAQKGTPVLGDFTVAGEKTLRTLLDFAPGHTADSSAAQAFRNAANAHQDYLLERVFHTAWRNYRFVFAGGDDILYAVDHHGRLLFHRITGKKGIGRITAPVVISPSGWEMHRFVFAGDNGNIYAVDQIGRLLFCRDTTRNGTGTVTNASVIGLGGWQAMKFLFYGGDGILYAVHQDGRLLFYRDQTQNGTGDVGNPSVIGLGGWQFMQFVFSGGNGILYAVNQEGKLLFYIDQNRNGTGDVGNPTDIGEGDWRLYRFVFADHNRAIYAVDGSGQLLITRDEQGNGTVKVAPPTIVGSGELRSTAQMMNLADVSSQILQRLNPDRTVVSRISAAVSLAGTDMPTSDPLEPIMDAPVFPQPMYEALRELSQDLLFPGLEHVPQNTVALLKTNTKFIESFLVGLNAEMSRELLWRGYPTDQRGTYFRHFWDSFADGNQLADIDAIHTWQPLQLGKNAGTGEQIVLLLRGELLRRYPNSVIYAVKAERTEGGLDLLPGPEHERHPLFRGTLKPDVTFLGFDLTEQEAIGDPGWFFVIQQQPTEPRFGMDAADFTKQPPPLTTWNNLSWQHVADTEVALKALSYASAKKSLPISVIDQVEWGKNSTQQAYITLQRPLRIAIHASEMIQAG
ncbi:MAG: tachylectin-related carbohydrate-binding protein [Verrucomicrobiales bacterium]